MEAIKPFCTEVMEDIKRTDINGADGSLGGSKAVLGQPTSEEMSRLTFSKFGAFPSHAQELHNGFARLLNRGSSLE